MRIVVLLSRLEAATEVIEATVQRARELKAGVTLLYVREEKLFELPFFSRSEPSLEEITDYLHTYVRDAGGDEWAILAYDDDPVDHLLLEVEREKAGLVISDLDGSERDELIDRVPVPLLLLEPGVVHRYDRGLIVVDPAYSGSSCFRKVQRMMSVRHWQAYLDYHTVATIGTDITLDPVVDSLNFEMEIEEEIMEARKKSFMELCDTEGIPGVFEVGELGFVEDIIARAEQEEAECLAVVVEDRETLLADALGLLSRRIRRDMLICFER